jgi:hypothetical protein
MTAQLQHTPTPWCYAPDSKHIRIHGGGMDHPIAWTPRLFDGALDQANAAHIVRCVNSHDVLLAALRELVEHAERVTESHARLENERGSQVATLTANVRKSLKQARAALAVAEKP